MKRKSAENPPVAKVLLSGENATACALYLCPANGADGSSVDKSQIFDGAFQIPLTNTFPSGEIETRVAGSASSVSTRCWVAVFHRSIPRLEQTARILPSADRLKP